MNIPIQTSEHIPPDTMILITDPGLYHEIEDPETGAIARVCIREPKFIVVRGISFS